MIKGIVEDISNIGLVMFTRVAQALVDDPTASLPEFTSHTRLSPVTLIGQDIAMMEEEQLQNILQTASAIFASHYLQAVAVSTTINGVQTIDLLAPYSTSSDSNVIRQFRKGLADRVGREIQSVANESFKLPSFDTPAMEAKEDGLNAHANLAVGRLLHVDIGEPGKTIKVPVTLTINPKVVGVNTIPKIISTVKSDTGFWDRLHQFRAGEIESVTDYLFALDLIEADRKALLEDDSGIYQEIQKRKRNGFFKRLLLGRPNLNNASAIHILSKKSVEDIEAGMKSRFSRARTRQEYFNTTNAMMVLEIDARMERFNLYQRGIDEVGTYTFRDIEQKGSNAGSIDMNALMKAYKLGEAPNTL